MRPVFKQPPLIEALIELSFEGPSQPDQTFPGSLYVSIKNEYPKKRQADQISLGLGKDNTRDQITPFISKAPILRFLDEEEQILVQLMPGWISMNNVKMYPGWDMFKSKFSFLKKNIFELREPKEANKINLRYINEVLIPSSKPLEDYLNILPNLPEQFSNEILGFSVSSSIQHLNPPIQLTFRLASHGLAPENKQRLILDLSASRALDDEKWNDEIDGWLDQAHEKIEKFFLSSFTQKCRQDIFEEVS
jgi:uncharacterized protein (TIGR04255 family)